MIPNDAGKGDVTFEPADQAKLNLNGRSETINGTDDFFHVVTNGSGTPSTLTVGDGDAEGTFAGKIEGNISFTKIGGGTQTLTGPNQHTGDTSINGGVLVINTESNLGTSMNAIRFGGGTLRPTAGINFTRNALTTAGAGGIDTNGFDSTINTVTGAGGFTKSGAGNLTANQMKVGGAVAVSGGTLAITPVADGALLAMNDNDFIVNYASGDPSPEFALRDKVKSIYQGGASGILHTPGAGDVTIAVAEKSEWGFTSFNGVAIEDTTVVGKYTYFGDANLDGKVTSDDYPSTSAWAPGTPGFKATSTSAAPSRATTTSRLTSTSAKDRPRLWHGLN